MKELAIIDIPINPIKFVIIKLKLSLKKLKLNIVKKRDIRIRTTPIKIAYLNLNSLKNLFHKLPLYSCICLALNVEYTPSIKN